MIPIRRLRAAVLRTTVLLLAGMLTLAPATARAELTVLMSGGFALAYQSLLPEFERTTGIKVVTTSGASQGSGPSTIKAQLERGARPDVVILSREGLDELIAAGRIVRGTDAGMATTPLGAAVRAGAPPPDLRTVDTLRQTLLDARMISMPGSTSGLFLRDEVFPRLGVAGRAKVTVTARGLQSTAMLAAGESDLALGPVSELVNQPGIDYAGTLPDAVQLVQEFAAAVVQGASQVDDAKRLIAFLASEAAAAAMRKAGMEPALTGELVATLAPTGRLRAAINFGNPVLAQQDPAAGEPRGVSVDLARELARRLGVPVEFVTFTSAGKVAEAAANGVWDIAFLAIDPGRATQIAFTPPYVIIEGTYLVPAGSPLKTIDDVDREGVRIAVGRGSAYDLYLSRAIRKATLVHAPTSQAVIDVFREQRLEVAAGVRQQLEVFASGRPELRIMDGRFVVIEQAIGTPRSREPAMPFLLRFVEDVKATGIVAQSLARSGQRDAAVAPAAR